MTAVRDLIGLRFGRLLVVSRGVNTKAAKATWDCMCDCGISTNVVGGNLIQGKVVSCGCFRVEITTENATKHGKLGTNEHNAWRSMRARCLDKSQMYYGGKGITFCPEWDAFDVFLHDMGIAPIDERGKPFELDRIDSDLGYFPENCRWLCKRDNAANAMRKRWNKVVDSKSNNL